MTLTGTHRDLADSELRMKLENALEHKGVRPEYAAMWADHYVAYRDEAQNAERIALILGES